MGFYRNVSLELEREKKKKTVVWEEKEGIKVGWVQRGIWWLFHQIWSLLHQNHPVELFMALQPGWTSTDGAKRTTMKQEMALS